jgi:hypothetical protein
MNERLRLRRIAGLTTLVALVAAITMVLAGGASAIVAGAGYTTTGATDNCIHGTPINCNSYSAKTDVYVSGGPTAGGIKTAGTYYFAIIAPGSQNTFISGGSAGGDLSLCGNDPVDQRTYTVGFDSGNPIITGYSGTTHGTANIGGAGKFVIDAADPNNLYCDTPNAGGVYILAICSAGATSPSQCKFDAFKVAESETCQADDPNCTPLPFGVVSGEKYYDANANGILDSSNGILEAGIPGWKIDWTDTLSGTFTTDPSGAFSSPMEADTYTFTEEQATNPQHCTTEVVNGASTQVCVPIWLQTGNLAGQFGDTGGDFTTLANKIYTVSVVDGGTTSGLNFGNVCLGGGGGLTLGYWSNKNGQSAQFSNTKLADTLAFLTAFNLRNATGANFDPGTYTAFRTWLLGATATNMAYMLSAQLSAMELNIRNLSVSGSTLIYAPGTTSADGNGLATVSSVMAEANIELGLHGSTLAGSAYRGYQEALKNALDRANNNLSFVQASQATCPAATFPAAP